MVELASIMYKINAKLEFLEEWGLKPKKRFVRGWGGGEGCEHFWNNNNKKKIVSNFFKGFLLSFPAYNAFTKMPLCEVNPFDIKNK